MKKRWIGILFFITSISAFFYFDLHHVMDLHFIKTQQIFLQELYDNHPIQMLVAFSSFYILTTALSLPTVIFLSVLAGAIFGLTTGAIVVSFTSALGATCAFLLSRWFFYDAVHERFKKYLKKFDDGMEKHGAFYLFTLRTTPVVPFFIVNLVMGLTTIKTRVFYFVSQVGMFPSKFIYVNAGTQLAALQTFGEILSLKVILSLLALAVIPITMKILITWWAPNVAS